MTRSTFLLAATLTGGAFAVTACRDGKQTPDVETTATTSADTVKVKGVWSDSVTAESRYTAHYVNGELVVIAEEMLLADSTSSSRRYFYDADYAPTRFVERRTLTAASSNSTPAQLQSLLDIFLTGDTVDSTNKQVDGVPKPVQPYEIENMRQHERELFARVPTTHTAPRINR